MGWATAGVIPPALHSGSGHWLRAGTSGQPTVIDQFSGLEWRICPVGKTWSGTACTGTATTASFSATATSCRGSWGGYSDWRAPTLDELETLVDRSHASPAIDNASFSSYGPGMMWSTTPIPGDPGHAVEIFFGEKGHEWQDSTSFQGTVACVRRGATAGPRRFSTVGPGGAVVRDDFSGLEWDRCLLGETWDGTTCTGTSTQVSWTDAMADCGENRHGSTGWRLPTVRELRLLRNWCELGQSPDTVAFPGLTEQYHWTSTEYADDPTNSAWGVQFIFRTYSRDFLKTSVTDLYARCVRGIPGCTEGVINPLNGNTYFYCRVPLAWAAAQAYCAEHGTHLASLTDAGEAAFAAGLLARHATATNSWVGASEPGAEGSWTWVSGEPWAYTRWNPGQPDDHLGNEDCLGVDRGSGNWNDFTCSNLVGFVCELEIP
ncbi:MAG: DUF1566 domain-containing protein [Deltaproteobacteria bacterium]|nr:DUF1566 domain-containing protein [Deltaproteobacteria bacterium]